VKAESRAGPTLQFPEAGASVVRPDLQSLTGNPASAHELMRVVSCSTAASSKSSETGGLANRSQLRTKTVHWPTSQMAAIVSVRWSAFGMQRLGRKKAL